VKYNIYTHHALIREDTNPGPVKPKIVICLGVPTFNALRRASGLKPVRNLEEGIASSFQIGNSEVICQAHTGQLGKNNRNKGGVNRVDGDWAAIKFLPFKSLKLINEENFINITTKKMENQKQNNSTVESSNLSGFEKAHEQLISDLEKNGQIILKDNGNNEHRFIAENRKIKVYRVSGKHKPISYNATRDLFLKDKHIGKTNKKEYSINGNYSDDIRYCIAIAKHLKKSKV